MSKKDYVMIARVIRTQRDQLADRPGLDSLAVAVLESTAARLSAAFGLDNPRFQKGKFMEACGFHA